jgi:hypothetical protein
LKETDDKKEYELKNDGIAFLKSSLFTTSAIVKLHLLIGREGRGWSEYTFFSAIIIIIYIFHLRNESTSSSALASTFSF